MDAAKLRAWWAHKQGLDGSLDETSPAAVLAGTGWARSVGGVNPYLTLFSRAGIGRAEVDAAVADVAVHELPSARGCTYIVPAEQYAVALCAGAASAGAELATARALGVPTEEIDRLQAAVLDAVADEPLDPKRLKDVLGDAVRNLGDAGRKKGLSTTLPVALGLLQAAGEIRRIPAEGRLDRQRFAYARWSPSPLTGSTPTPEQTRTELARLYWAWTGGATIAQFRWFSAFKAAEARAAVEPLGLVPLTDRSDLLALPEDAKAYADFDPPASPRYVLVGWLDGIALLRRDLASLLDPADAERDLDGIAKRPLGRLPDLPAQAVLDRGRVVGLWDYDPDAGEIAWASFVPVDDALREAVERTAAFVRDQLGDARGSSQDNPAARRPKLAALRALR
ncbi:MAG TPA: crosslink repair DNA glycosylase YcaQ family protein [Streptosporangiales bacterium]